MSTQTTPTITQVGNPTYEVTNDGGLFSGEDVIEVLVAVEYGDWRLDSRWWLVGGRPETMTVTFTRFGSPVTGAGIRGLPLGEMLAESRRIVADDASNLLNGETAAIELLAKFRSGEDVPIGAYRGAVRTLQRLEDLGESEVLLEPFLVTGPRRGKTLSADDHRQVAEIYRAAYGRGDSVLQAVADALYISKSTASKRIDKARKAGLLDGVGHPFKQRNGGGSQ